MPHRALFALVAAGVIAIVVYAAAVNGSPAAGPRFQQIASSFDEPVYVAQPASEPDNLYVVERRGRIRVFAGGRVRAQPFLDIRGLVQSGYVEQGLLSVAFHPKYARNRRLFVYYTDRRGDIRVVEYRSDGARALPSSRRVLLVVRHRAYSNHDGGQLQFGPDGRLYAGTGDGGSGGDPSNNGQNLRSRLAKLLKLNVDRRGAKWQIAAYGLRNPWRFSWDRATRALYIADVGQDDWEEIDYRSRAGQRKLTNYGWSVYEARARYKSRPRNPRGQLVFPIAAYAHAGGRCSVTGGYVYRGSAVPAARGRYFYGDWCTGEIWSLTVSRGRAHVRREASRIRGLSSFGEDARGELYAVSLAGGLYKLVD